MEKIVNLAKRRGFVFPSSEIYGGLAGFWDWGPLGVLLKNNIKREWWRTFVQKRSDMVGIDGTIISAPKVWMASGHVDTFADFLVDCQNCKHRFRGDHLIEQYTEQSIVDFAIAYLSDWIESISERYGNAIVKKKISLEDLNIRVAESRKNLLESGIDPDEVLEESKKKKKLIIKSASDRQEDLSLDAEFEAWKRVKSNIGEFINHYIYYSQIPCPSCKKTGEFTKARKFNLMLKTNIGPVEDSSSTGYLRPETAQSIFINFENVRESTRKKLPFGIAQIGKAFRNEITPGNFVFRQREFEQMEIEYFVRPGDDDAHFSTWVEMCYQWFLSLGLKAEHLRKFEQPASELAHYSKATTDIEFTFPIEKGWGELMGIANRTDYDLKQHGQHAKGSPEAFATPIDDEGKEKKVPFVIEPSMGVDRAALAFLLDAYTIIDGGRSTTTESIKDEEVVLKLHPRLAPYTVAILPLSKKPELTAIAEPLLAELRKTWMVDYDQTGSIGKRYRRQDEIGTPLCVTVDFDTIEGVKRPKGTVTVRDRDTMEQHNVAIDELPAYVAERLR